MLLFLKIGCRLTLLLYSIKETEVFPKTINQSHWHQPFVRLWNISSFTIIMLYFTTQNLLNPLQHGFRPNHSCQTQLIDFIDEVQQSMNARQQTDLVYIDFSKAFDTIPHRKLICKLESYGVRGPLLHWISSRLSKRHQRVIVDGESSGAAPVKSGVQFWGLLCSLFILMTLTKHYTFSSAICWWLWYLQVH